MAEDGIGAILMKALGLGPQPAKKEPQWTPEQEAAPWTIPLETTGGPGRQGGRGPMHAMPDGSMMQGAQHPGGMQDELDALVAEIKRNKQKAAAATGNPIPR